MTLVLTGCFLLAGVDSVRDGRRVPGSELLPSGLRFGRRLHRPGPEERRASSHPLHCEIIINIIVVIIIIRIIIVIIVVFVVTVVLFIIPCLLYTSDAADER